MDKKRYQKPTVMGITGRAASGLEPQACVPGTGVSGYFCIAGMGDIVVCYVGTDGTSNPYDCVNGPSALASCIPGGMANLECESGIEAIAYIPCTTGPIPID